MRKLTDEDLAGIIGRTIQGYRIEVARVKQGPYVDSDHYGVLLGRNEAGEYVTWQFHLKNDESVSAYWGHFISDREEALRDFDARSMGVSVPQWFDVTVTETLTLTVRVEAHSQQEAEQIVSDDWKKQEFILDSECFAGVEFQAVPIVDEPDKPPLEGVQK